MKLVDRIDGITNFYYFKPWKELTEVQKRRSIELYAHWTKFANTNFEEELQSVKKVTTQKT